MQNGGYVSYLIGGKWWQLRYVTGLGFGLLFCLFCLEFSGLKYCKQLQLATQFVSAVLMDTIEGKNVKPFLRKQNIITNTFIPQITRPRVVETFVRQLGTSVFPSVTWKLQISNLMATIISSISLIIFRMIPTLHVFIFLMHVQITFNVTEKLFIC